MKTPTSRIYLAEVNRDGIQGPNIRLVRAVSMPSALRHVVKSSIAVRLATQDECIEHAELTIEDATKEVE